MCSVPRFRPHAYHSGFWEVHKCIGTRPSERKDAGRDRGLDPFPLFPFFVLSLFFIFSMVFRSKWLECSKSFLNGLIESNNSWSSGTKSCPNKSSVLGTSIPTRSFSGSCTREILSVFRSRPPVLSQSLAAVTAVQELSAPVMANSGAVLMLLRGPPRRSPLAMVLMF
jgi:hypothetical protein